MTARDLVTRRITRRARHFPDLTPEPLDAAALADLDPRDAALAQAIDGAVARRWLTLAAVCESQLKQPWTALEPRMQAILLVGAAQVLLLERVPGHAAINEAVNWAKANVRPKAGGLVNAVLRRVADLRTERVPAWDPQRRDELPLSDGSAWRLGAPVFADDPMLRLAQCTSHGEAIIEHWMSTFGRETTVDLARHGLVQPPIIICGVGDPLPPECMPHDAPGCAVYTGAVADLPALLKAHPTARVQDPTSAEPVNATAGRTFATILDACAGLGTKTRQLAAVHPGATIIATDIDATRFATLRESFADRERVQVVPFDELRRHDARADLLVLDLPCTNTGVLARRPEAKYRFNAEHVEAVTALQRQIIADAIPLLAPAGVILLATCAITPAENERQAQWLTKWHPFRQTAAKATLPAGRPGDPPSAYHDGGFFALFEPLPR